MKSNNLKRCNFYDNNTIYFGKVNSMVCSVTKVSHKHQLLITITTLLFHEQISKQMEHLFFFVLMKTEIISTVDGLFLGGLLLFK